MVSPKDSLAGLRREAQELFDAGKLQEAGRVSEAILAKDPEDSFALSLKNYARASLAEPKAPAEEAVPSERTAQLHEGVGAAAGTIRQCAGSDAVYGVGRSVASDLVNGPSYFEHQPEAKRPEASRRRIDQTGRRQQQPQLRLQYLPLFRSRRCPKSGLSSCSN